MARTKQTAARYFKPLITWTRFYLPPDQEWPVWAVGDDDFHAGPLVGYSTRKLRLARIVDDPEQAAYIVEWEKEEDFRRFQSSPDCTIFLNNLPESKDATAAVSHAGAQLEQLTLDPSAPSSPAMSRFLLCQHSTEAATRELDGLITLTAYLVPGQFVPSEPYAHLVLGRTLEEASRRLSLFMPFEDHRLRQKPNLSTRFMAIWLCVLDEDAWVVEKFGAPSSPPQQEQPQQQKERMQQQRTQRSEPSRAVFFHVFRWSECFWEPHEAESMAAQDKKAKEAWEEFASRIMPPATAWAQERWDIRDVPRFDPPLPQEGPEWEESQELDREIRAFCRDHGFDVSDSG